jgi:RNA polymerase sigma-70 factor (ECF subfamily)
MSHSPDPDRASAGEPFASTHWSLVLQARDRASPRGDEALAALCRAYWYPLYAYVRRQVGCMHQAEDLTQEFFARLLDREFLAAVDPHKGKFRAFLLACCKHFLANQRDRERAQKRGGGQTILSFDFPTADRRYRHEPADVLTPERLFERHWALTLLDAVLEQLRSEYHAAGKAQFYEHLKDALLGDHEALSYSAIAAALGTTEAAVKKAAQRLRQRYRELLRRHIAETVADSEAVEDEIRELFAVLGS